MTLMDQEALLFDEKEAVFPHLAGVVLTLF
jgi:hypothetical protein